MRLPKRNKIGKKKVIKLNKHYIYNNNIYQIKPNGFWYACYNDWYNWIIEENMKSFLHKYIHKINIIGKTNIRNKDKNKCLIINNLQDFDIFYKKYGNKDSIFWNKVVEDYGGIEICPFFIERKHIFWYSMWDVASGCIWNTNIISNTELIYEKTKNKYIKIN